jgi:exodeoxyribonuclease III
MKLDRLEYRTEKWDVAMLKQLKQLELTKPVIWCGDLNVAHQEIDIHDPKSNKNKSPGFTDAERESFGNILENGGFVDTFRQLNPDKKQFTYWSYRFNARQKNKGWRLDYFVLSKKMFNKVVSDMGCFFFVLTLVNSIRKQLLCAMKFLEVIMFQLV